MLRSFTDRVFAGVCGGLAASLRLPAWLLRVVFVVLSILSLGVFAVLYLLLWWVVPQQSFALGRERRGLALPIVLLCILIAVIAWVGRDMGYLRTPAGMDLFWPGVLLLLAAVFFLRQVRA
jgi:phage shock protein PspC (stress-responsive transcriptional regulator)